MICTNCKTDHAHRSHRQGLKDYILSFFRHYPYRCNECGHRFYGLPPEPPKPSEPPSATEAEIRATRKSYEWKRQRRDFLLYGSALLAFLGFLYYLTRDRGNSSNGE